MKQTRQTHVTLGLSDQSRTGIIPLYLNRTSARHVDPPKGHSGLELFVRSSIRSSRHRSAADAYIRYLQHQQPNFLDSGGTVCPGCIRQCIEAGCFRPLPVLAVLSPIAVIPQSSRLLHGAFTSRGDYYLRRLLVLRGVKIRHPETLPTMYHRH